MAFTSFRFRGTEGQFKGLWLTDISVTQNGLPFQVLDWENVARRANQFVFNPTFQADEKAAWGGITKQNAQTFQSIASQCGIRTEIVEP